MNRGTDVPGRGTGWPSQKGEDPAHLEAAVNFFRKPGVGEGKRTRVIPTATNGRGGGGFKRQLTKNHQNSTRVGCESKSQ